MKSVRVSFPTKTSFLLVFCRFGGWRKTLFCGLFKDIPVDVRLFYSENSLILQSGVFSGVPGPKLLTLTRLLLFTQICPADAPFRWVAPKFGFPPWTLLNHSTALPSFLKSSLSAMPIQTSSSLADAELWASVLVYQDHVPVPTPLISFVGNDNHLLPGLLISRTSYVKSRHHTSV